MTLIELGVSAVRLMKAKGHLNAHRYRHGLAVVSSRDEAPVPDAFHGIFIQTIAQSPSQTHAVHVTMLVDNNVQDYYALMPCQDRRN